MDSSFSSQSFLGSTFFPPSQPSSQPTSSTPLAQNPNESIFNSSTLSVLSQASNATSILSQSLIYKQQREQVKKQTKYYGPGVSSKYGNPYLDRKRKERLERKKLKMMEERKEMARLSARNASPSQTVGSSSFGQGNQSYVSQFSNESFRSTTGFEDQDDLSTSVVNQSGKRSFGRVYTVVESSGDASRGVMGPPGKKLKDGEGKGINATPSSSKTTKKVTPGAKFLMDVLDDKQPAPIPFNQKKSTPSPSSSTPSTFGLSSAFASSTPSSEVVSASVQSPVKFPFSTSTPKVSPAPKEKGKEPIEATPIFTSTQKTFSFSSGFKSQPAQKEPTLPTTQSSVLSTSASQPTSQLASKPSQPTSQPFTAQLSIQGSSSAQAPTFGSFGKPAQSSAQPPKTEPLQKPQTFSFTTAEPLVPTTQPPKSEASAKEEPTKAVISKEEQPKKVTAPEIKETATGIDTQSIPRSLKDEVKKIPYSELPTRSFVFPNATSLSAHIDSKIIEKIKASPVSDLPVKDYKFPTVANFMKSGVKPFERSSSSEEMTDKTMDEKVEPSQTGLKMSTSVPSAVAASSTAVPSLSTPVPAATPTTAPSTFNWGASGFTMKKSGWECPACMVNNKEESTKCISCETDKPGSKPASSTPSVSSFAPPSSVPSATSASSTATAAPSTFNWGASGFSLKKAGWDCPSCMVNNKEDSVKCISCETDKPGSKPASSTSTASAFVPPSSVTSSASTAAAPTTTAPPTFNWGASGFSMKKAGWECPSCMVNNKEDSVKCISCETDKPGSKPASSKPASTTAFIPPPTASSTAPPPSSKTSAPSTFNWGASGFSMKKAGWECPSCMVNNKEDSVKCVSCETDKPGTVSSTSAQSASQSSTTGFTAPLFTFNAGGNKSSSSGFGGSAGATTGFSGFGSAGSGSNLFAAFGKQGSSEDKDKQAKESKKDSIDDSSKKDQLSTSEAKPSPFSFTPGTSSSVSSSGFSFVQPKKDQPAAFSSSTPTPSSNIFSQSQTSGSVFGTSSAFSTPTDSKKDSVNSKTEQKDNTKDNNTNQSNASGFGSASFGSTSKPNTSGTGSGFGTTSVFGFGTGSSGTTNPAVSAGFSFGGFGGSATSSENTGAGNTSSSLTSPTGFAFGGVGSTSAASFGSFGSSSGSGNSSVFGSSGFSFGSAPASGSGFSFGKSANESKDESKK